MTARGATRLRRCLRMGQLGCLIWIVEEIISLLLAAPAVADHCAAFSDCFNQANSAAEAAFGLALLAGLSLVLDLTPGLGDVKGVIEAGTGRDLITGEELSPWDRSLGLATLIPFTDLARSGRHLDDILGLGRHGEAGGARHLDDISGLGRHGDDLAGGARHLDEIGGPGRRLIDEYRDPATTTVRRRQISEQLGTVGGERHIREVTGRENLTTIRPRTDGDVAGYEEMVVNGEPWPHMVEFGGSRATNLVYFDGETMHILEAKGGSSAYGTRESRVIDPGNEIDQTNPDYPFDVAYDMSRSTLKDGRNEIGQAIEQAYIGDQVRYVGVRTGGRDELLAGQPTTTVEVFRQPGG